jgi:hypothetical protein
MQVQSQWDLGNSQTLRESHSFNSTDKEFIVAGNFVLKSITASDLIIATRHPHIKWSTTAHKKGDIDGTGKPFQGWTPDTREVLRKALQGQAIPNRNLLPPHRYLEIETWNKLSEDEKRYVTMTSWADSMEYPLGQGLGLKALTGQVQAKWVARDKNGALIEALKTGDVSIEVYYHGGIEIT